MKKCTERSIPSAFVMLSVTFRGFGANDLAGGARARLQPAAVCALFVLFLVTLPPSARLSFYAFSNIG